MTKEQHLGKYPIVANNDGTILYVKRSDALKAMQEHAKQQAIEFAIHYAKSAIQNGYVKPSAVDGDRMEERYAHFIDNQFIEQQNKP